LTATPALRRDEINLQVALANALMHVKGYAGQKTKLAVERARLLIEQAEALGEPPEDPLQLFSVLYGFWVAKLIDFNGDACRDLAAQFLTLAEKQRATAPLMIGRRLMGTALHQTGDLATGRTHYDQALALYDPGEHRQLATRFGQDLRVSILSFRSQALWTLGFPEAALADADRALKDAREIGQAATLMYALCVPTFTLMFCGNYATAKVAIDELIALADEKGSLGWQPVAILQKGWVLALTGKASEAVHALTTGVRRSRSGGTTLWLPLFLPYLALSYLELGRVDLARQYIDEAISAVQTSQERWSEAEINRIAGEIAVKSPEPDAAKAEAYFARALAVARHQQAKSWELRAAMSLARLWRNRGKVQQARELLAPVYGWFTEGFDTRDLKEAKALLEELAM
jgi:predicted ATPase